MTGLISSTGVPSAASRPITSSTVAARLTISTIVLPIRLGRTLARWAKIPTRGYAGSPRGWRVPLPSGRRGDRGGDSGRSRSEPQRSWMDLALRWARQGATPRQAPEPALMSTNTR